MSHWLGVSFQVAGLLISHWIAWSRPTCVIIRIVHGFMDPAMSDDVYSRTRIIITTINLVWEKIGWSSFSLKKTLGTFFRVPCFNHLKNYFLGTNAGNWNLQKINSIINLTPTLIPITTKTPTFWLIWSQDICTWKIHALLYGKHAWGNPTPPHQSTPRNTLTKHFRYLKLMKELTYISCMDTAM